MDSNCLQPVIWLLDLASFQGKDTKINSLQELFEVIETFKKHLATFDS